jgi:hypothetical protein
MKNLSDLSEADRKYLMDQAIEQAARIEERKMSTPQVRSAPMTDGRVATESGRRDWSLTIAKFGVLLALLPFGGIFWAVNGGFSVLGLEVLAGAFNSAGRLFWAAVSAITFDVPARVPGLPTAQPLVPWCGVLAATLLQIALVWRKLRGKSIPTWLVVFTILLSIYDLATTYFGLGTVGWIVRAGFIIQFPIALLLTFGLEATIGYMLRR